MSQRKIALAGHHRGDKYIVVDVEAVLFLCTNQHVYFTKISTSEAGIILFLL